MGFGYMQKLKFMMFFHKRVLPKGASYMCREKASLGNRHNALGCKSFRECRILRRKSLINKRSATFDKIRNGWSHCLEKSLHVRISLGLEDRASHTFFSAFPTKFTFSRCKRIFAVLPCTYLERIIYEN